MSAAVTVAVTDCCSSNKRFVNANILEIGYHFSSGVEFTHIDPCMVNSTGHLSHNYRTGCNGRTVSTFPIRTFFRTDFLFLHIHLGCYTIIGDCTLVINTDPVCCIHRNRIVPAESRGAVTEMGERIIYESGTIDALITDKVGFKGLITVLIVDTCVSLTAECIRRAEQRCRLCNYLIGRGEYFLFGFTCCMSCNNTTHCSCEHRNGAESCHEPCTDLLYDFAVFEHSCITPSSFWHKKRAEFLRLFSLLLDYDCVFIDIKGLYCAVGVSGVLSCRRIESHPLTINLHHVCYMTIPFVV